MTRSTWYVSREGGAEGTKLGLSVRLRWSDARTRDGVTECVAPICAQLEKRLHSALRANR